MLTSFLEWYKERKSFKVFLEVKQQRSKLDSYLSSLSCVDICGLSVLAVRNETAARYVEFHTALTLSRELIDSPVSTLLNCNSITEGIFIGFHQNNSSEPIQEAVTSMIKVGCKLSFLSLISTNIHQWK